MKRFDEHRGVVCLIQVVGGQLKENERITTFASIKESKDIDSRRFDTVCVCVEGEGFVFV